MRITRNDILRRDLTDLQLKPGSNGCAVLTGTLHDPYSGKEIAFVRGQGTSSNVQIDHVVALSNAWQTGAQQLTDEQRKNLANDPLNLQATDGRLNESKGAGDAATWLPPNKKYRCIYVARQVQVKAHYRLWMTPPERDAIGRILAGCGARTLPPAVTSADKPPDPVAPRTSATTPMERTSAPPPASTPGGHDVYFQNCAAAWAAGAAPLTVGQPGYRTKMDGDRDGIACEHRP